MEEKESNQEKLKSIKNSKQGLDGLKFKSFFTQQQSIPEPQTKTTDHQNSSSIDPTHSTTNQSRESNMSKEELKYMINKLRLEGYEVNQMNQRKETYASAVLQSNGGSGTCNKNIFFSSNGDQLNLKNDRKRKNIPKKQLNKSYDNLNFHTLLVKNIDDKAKYLNPFKLKNDIKKMFPKSVNADLLPYGDIRVFFNSINDRMEAKTTKLKDLFGEKAIVEETKFSLYKIVLHSIPNYINEQDLKNYFDSETISFKEIKIKPLKNNEYFGTAFVSLNDKKNFDDLTAKGFISVSNRRFKISKYINRKVVQCFKCQKYGHTAHICYNNEVKCRFCSKNHESKNCDQKNNLKCANCNENHKSSAFNCKVRQKYILQKNKWLINNKEKIKSLNIDKEVITKAKKIYGLPKNRKPATNNQNPVREKIVVINDKNNKNDNKIQKDNNKKVIKKSSKIPNTKSKVDWETILEEKINKIFNEKIEKLLDKIFNKYLKTIDFSNLKTLC